MSIHSVPTQRRHAASPIEQAGVALLRLVMMDGWRPEPAARVLRRRVGNDQRLLRLLHVHVRRAMLDRPTHVDRRAHATLERALGGDPLALTTLNGAMRAGVAR